MKAIDYLLENNVNENDIVNSIINFYFNVDQRREFNQHLYKLYVTSVIDAEDEIELPISEFESTEFKETYLDYISNIDILTELEQYLSSIERDNLEQWLIREYDIDYIDELDD